MRIDSTIQWMNENEERKYPISETATCVDDLGVMLETDVLADMCVTAPNGSTNVMVSSVYISPLLVSVAVSCDQGGLLTATFLRTKIVPYRAYFMNAVVPNASGWVVFGAFVGNYTRYHHFAAASQALLESKAVRVVPEPGVRAFQRLDNDGTQQVSGIVSLRGSEALSIYVDPVNDKNIIISLVPEWQARFLSPCYSPAGSKNCGVPVIRKINNVPPDSNGAITLRFE